MLALSIRQPYAELILRGIKTAELRSRSTRIVGERFYIYASKVKATVPIWSKDLEVGTPPAWLAELAKQVRLIKPNEDLPTGVIVGTAVIDRVIAPDSSDGLYRWQLRDVQRLVQPKKPTRHPQPMWFRPW